MKENLLKIVTFNINGLRARLDTLTGWLKKTRPDLVALQEIKIQERDFPYKVFENIGYNAYVNGQKSFNGVALLTKKKAKIISKSLPGDSEDIQARFLEIYYEEKRFICIYLPNGNPKDSEKFNYKLMWMDRLNEYCEKILETKEEVIILGDFNVIPQKIDCKYPEDWESDALFDPVVRERFNFLLNLGYVDAIRILDNSSLIYTQWDYRNRAWQTNNGVRIDHILLSPTAADHLDKSWIDKDLRDTDKPSDHTPVFVTLDKNKKLTSVAIDPI